MTGLHELGALGEDSVARVDRVAARVESCAHDRAHVQIGGGAAALEREERVRAVAGGELAVLGRVDREGLDAAFARGPGDA